MKSPGNHNDKNAKTSWGSVADWYAEHLMGDDTYHAKVVAPNLLRVLNLHKGSVLDLACGEGYFTRLIADEGAKVTGADISQELIDAARAQDSVNLYVATPAEDLHMFANNSFDAVTCVLALQNMERIEPVFKEVARVVKTGGRFVFVINHPAFRIPKRSEWGFDERSNTQYRRLDGYLSASRAEIDMAPGKHGSKKTTYSFHRSLQDYFKALRTAGFAVARLEEWISHKESQSGPRKEAEDTARKEFPLFMMLEATKQ